ncbi:MAG TPA: DUF6476 family protein [Stellaceae bacterium]|nr:DUF6476 family protein [Stellaceae bacterium]
MRGLKLLVVVMGVMLVVGVAALTAAIAVKLKGRPQPAAAFAAPPLDLPPGSRIEAMSTGPDRVVLDLVLADGTRQLVVIDLATGRRLGMIPVRTER